MRYNNIQKIVCLFMIYLVLSLTIFTANALAGFSYSITGERGIQGYRAKEDSLNFDIWAEANVSFLTRQGTEYPLFCENADNKVHCQFATMVELTDLNVIPLTLIHKRDPPVEYPVSVVVDSLEPTISYSLEKINNVLVMNYTIVDKAYQGNDNCSGIENIDISIDNKQYQEVITGNKCFFSGTIKHNLSDGFYGILTTTISTYDKVGNENTNTSEILLDTQGPIITDNYEIYSGNVLRDKFSRTADLPSQVVVYVEDENLAVSQVYGDLSGLNLNPANNYLNMNAICNKLNGNKTYKCVFNGISVRPRNDTLTIKVKATDTEGNINEKTLSKTITIVSDPGAPLFIGPEKKHCNDDLTNCYINNGRQTFILEINQGSDFNNTILNYGIADTKVPSLCKSVEDKWYCWANYEVKETEPFKVYIAYPSADYFGNQLSSLERTIYVDNVPPIIASNITPNMPGCLADGDELILSFKVNESDSDELIAYVNTTNITSSGIHYGECEREGNEWDCSITINGFITTYDKKMKKVIVEDLAGNKDQENYEFEVCIKNPNAMPNLISSIKQSNTPRVDRRTASFLPVKTYIPLKIDTKGNGKIISMNVDKCSALDDDGNELMSSENYFIGNNLVLSIGKSGAKLPLGSIDINCTISAKMRQGKNVFLNPEIETFIIEAETYNNPLGTLDDAINNKIKQQKAAIRDLNDEIDDRKAWDSFFGTLCRAVQVIVKINSILQTLKSALYAVCLVLGEPIGESIWTSVAPPLNAIDKVVQKFIWPTGIDIENWIGYIVKGTCQIYTCQFYKPTGLYSMVMDTVGLLEAGGMKNADESFTNDYAGHKMKHLDDETLMVDGVIYELESDEKGRQIWKAEDGSKIAYSNNGWDLIEGPITVSWEEEKRLNLFKSMYGEGQFDSTGTIYSTDAGYEVVNENGVWVKREIINPQTDTKTAVDPKTDPPKTDPAKTDPAKTDPKKTTSGNYYGISNADKKLMEKENSGLYKKINENIYSLSSEEEETLKTKYPNSYNKIYSSMGVRVSSTQLVQSSYKDVGTGQVYQAGQWPTSHHIFQESNGAYFMWVNKNKLYLYKRGGSYFTKNPDESTTKVIYDITGRSFGEDGDSPNSNIQTQPNTQTKSNDISIDMQDINSANQQFMQRNMKFYADLESNDWIVNPYRSVHYDALCNPAMLYNLQKERQIRCKYLSCLQKQAQGGTPTIACDMDYGIETCLYLDSAQWKMDQGIWPGIRGLFRSALSAAVGIGIQLLYSKVLCPKYLKNMADETNLVKGSNDVTCGLAGTLLQAKEIGSVFGGDIFKTLMDSSTPKDPSEIHDYCIGVDINE